MIPLITRRSSTRALPLVVVGRCGTIFANCATQMVPADGDNVARKSIEQRLAELDARRASLKARIGKEERARDTRRKVLLGALVLDRLERSHDEEFAKRLRDWLARELPGFLTRDVDRTLLADLIRDPKIGVPKAE